MDGEPSDERDRADLAALADGSLPQERRPEVEARVAASPALGEALARQRAALSQLAAAGDERAPAGLRLWLDDQSAPAPVARRRTRWVGRIAAAATAAAVALAVVLSLGSTAAEQLAEATASAKPGPFTRDAPTKLTVDDVTFPMDDPWPLTPIGSRAIDVDGRRGLVVAYAAGGARVDYAIVARPGLDLPDGEGRYRSFTFRGRPAVMWHREGRTCLLLGDDEAGDATLRKLARATKYY